jgi:DNA-binding NarL/FixJ family response regulator
VWRVFCSDGCKSRDYRRRKDLVQRLKEGGKPLKEIAKQLNLDVATVKKWVKGTD